MRKNKTGVDWSVPLEKQTHSVWCSMRWRCGPTSTGNSRKRYFLRGIRVCQEWMDSFQAFVRDVGWRPDEKLTLERINNDGNYEPGNVKWATRGEQNRNRNFEGTPGVRQRKCGSWEAYIKVLSKKIHLGFTETKEEALIRRDAADRVVNDLTKRGVLYK